MKQKLLMMLAALMLMGTSAMAQSETLKGDVNGDGAVDVADIAAVIQIMKDNGDIETKYYWYAGQENPASIDDITKLEGIQQVTDYPSTYEYTKNSMERTTRTIGYCYQLCAICICRRRQASSSKRTVRQYRHAMVRHHTIVCGTEETIIPSYSIC